MRATCTATKGRPVRLRYPSPSSRAATARSERSAAPEATCLANRALFGLMRFQAAFVSEAVAKPRCAADVLALFGHVPHRRRGPLPNRLSFPLRDGPENVEDQATGGGPGVHLLGDGKEGRAVRGSEVVGNELAEIPDRAGEAVELDDKEGLRHSTAQHAESSGKARPLESLGAQPGVHDHVHEVQGVQLRIGSDLSLL
jgi:hypothetical protein